MLFIREKSSSIPVQIRPPFIVSFILSFHTVAVTLVSNVFISLHWTFQKDQDLEVQDN